MRLHVPAYVAALANLLARDRIKAGTRESASCAITLAERGASMLIEFDEEADLEGSVLRTFATVDQRRVECRAGMEVVTELDDRATQSGVKMGKNAIARSLRPYFKRKIDNGSFDNEDRNSVTLLVHELVSFMHGH